MAKTIRQRIGDAIAGNGSKALEGQQIPFALQPMWMQTPPPKTGRDLLKSYSTTPFFKMTVGRIAETTARIPWIVEVARKPRNNMKSFRYSNYTAMNAGYRRKHRKHLRTTKAPNVVFDRYDEHPLLDLLARCNIQHGGWSVAELIQIHVDVLGEAVLIKERSGLGVPINLWPVDPLLIQNIASPLRPWFEILLDGKIERIPRSEVIYISKLNPSDIYRRGMGTGFAISDELQIDKYATAHLKAAYFNNLRSDTIISADGLTQEDTLRLETDWKNKFRQLWNRFTPYFLNKNVQVHTLNQPMKDAGTLEMRKMIGEITRIVYGVPPEILGIVQDSNRATIAAADHIMAKYVTDPRKDFIRAAFQEQLVGDFDDRLILDYECPIEEDREFILKVAEKAPWSRDVDEWRDLQDLEPMENEQGKGVYAAPLNLRFMRGHDIDEDMPAPDTKKPKPKPDAEDDDEEDDTKAQSPTVIKAPPLDNSQIERIINSIDPKELAKRLNPLRADAVEDFAKQLLKDAGLSFDFDISDPAVIEFLSGKETTVRLIKTNNTTRDRIRAALVSGMEEGETGAALAQRIKGTMQNMRGSRALVIAETEVGRAQNFAHQSAMEQGEIPNKEWLTAKDDRVRDSHETMDGQVIPTKDSFVSGAGNTAKHPGGFGKAEEDIFCRCVIVANFDGKSIKATNEKQAEVQLKAADRHRRAWERKARREVIRAFTVQEQAALRTLRSVL